MNNVTAVVNLSFGFALWIYLFALDCIHFIFGELRTKLCHLKPLIGTTDLDSPRVRCPKISEGHFNSCFLVLWGGGWPWGSP